ncbi:hypothetical protein [Rhodocyclus tenuis]|uniref:Uncharacterized protein n=1 Tax=Rhodocyclus tenuis TaxID=1066 RepID=A0A840GCC4_RHOTE|nr:hypothetical protein [Rhodocyclus tenuis]MBB4246242.1 hypothetical protein [Rhodocyclus tenuis]
MSQAPGAPRRTRKQPHLLAFRPKLKIAAHRLPFVGKEHTEDNSFSFWNVPAKGDYMGGRTTGEAIAGMYLKHIREDANDCCGLYLGWMVLAWMERLSSGDIKHGSPEYESLRGQMVGCMSELSRWLGAAARALGSSLDDTTNESLLANANRGIGFDTEAFFEYCTRKEQLEESRG